MKTIDERYIKTFLPIQELDEVKPIAATGLPDVKPDDLFFMSLISVYATSTEDAIAVSKKICYRNLMNKLSADLSIEGILLSIDLLCTSLSVLSVQVNNDISALSNAIVLSTFTLSTYTEQIRDDLSNTISSNYVTKFEQDLSTIIRYSNSPANPADIAQEIHISDGRVTVTEWCSVSDLIVPKDWKLSQSALSTDRNSTLVTVLPNLRLIVFPLSTDCYLNCMISAFEKDATCTPLYMYLHTNTEEIIVDQFNNPGGYSGTTFYNYYSSFLPLKSLNNTSVILKYADNLFFDTRTQVMFHAYNFYAVPSVDDLAKYVKRLPEDARNQLAGNKDDLHKLLYKMTINDDGLISSIESAYYGPATDDLLGLIKTLTTAESNMFGVRLSSNEGAYVNIPPANPEAYGLIKTAPYSYISKDHSIDCGLSSKNDGIGYVEIPKATNDEFGVIKTCESSYIIDYEGSDSLSTFIHTDLSGHGYVKVPTASYDHYGVIKAGLPEITPIHISRSVYVDDDGFAKVNVVTNVGIGQFKNDSEYEYNGYSKDIKFDFIDNPTPASQETTLISTFTGQTIACSEFGNNIWKSDDSVDISAYVAEVVISGISPTDNIDPILIVCNGIAVATLNINLSKMKPNKMFIDSKYLGLFSGEKNNIIALITDANQSDLASKIEVHFLIKYLNEK